ncbi:excinuclease ABC subunit A [Thioclava sp. GXIMD4216]|uniref:Excinuclease ABC subunit A n=1 Tax=Thioclava litoralis TaxID=3076557 RepID=A0ABZ1E1J8_9RHOB|nr:excinuclease ABC subunit A [Thioclava sp. FTW29]
MNKTMKNSLILATTLSLAPLVALADPPWQKGDHKGMPPGIAKKVDDHHRGDNEKVIVIDRRDDHRDDRRVEERRVDDHRFPSHEWRRGERIDRDYVVIRDPGRYGLDPHYTYYRSYDHVYRVDKTGQMLALIGAVNAILN